MHYDVSCLLPVYFFHFRFGDNERSRFSAIILLQLSCTPSVQDNYMSTPFFGSEFRNLSFKAKILARDSNFGLAAFLRRVTIE